MLRIKLRNKRATIKEAVLLRTRSLFKPREKVKVNTKPLIGSSTYQIPSPLEVPELLESILQHVDERSLLVSAQRVNKRWREAIENSPRLQKKLFLMPDDSDAAARDPRHNPLLAAAFPFCFDDLTAYPYTARPVIWAKSDVPAALPPVLKQRRANPLTQLPQSWHLWGPRHAAFGRLEASWRRMLVHQPPVIPSELLKVVQRGQPQKWIPLPRRLGPGLEMQELMLCIVSEFRLELRYGGRDENGMRLFDDDQLVIGVQNATGFEVDEDLEWPHVAGFKVIWRLQEPAYEEGRRVVEGGYERSDEGSLQESGVARQHVILVHDVELESAAPLDRHFEQLKEILFPL
ncbi:hypothetical protein PG984_006185 [Apiospora sp. TS-2023a]